MELDKAVFVLGSPSHTFESGASSIARVLESFRVGEVEVFYSGFAEAEAQRLRGFINGLFGVEVSLRPLPGTLSEAVDVLVKELTADSLAVPTAGSVLGAVALTNAADRVGARIAHVMFPFGPWSGFFYPYIPRYLQPILVLGDPIDATLNRFDARNAENFLGTRDNAYINTKLSRAIARACLKLNASLQGAWVNDASVPELTLELREELGEKDVLCSVYLRTPTSSVKVCDLAKTPRQQGLRGLPVPASMQQSVKASIGTGSHSREALQRLLLEAFYMLAGGRDACLRRYEAYKEEAFKKNLAELYDLLGFEVLNLDPHGVYVVDTNMVYRGVHNLARPGGPRIIVPYCVRYEVLDKLARSKSPCMKYQLICVRLALEMLENYASRVPSNPVNCDMAIPAVDPELLKGATILSADRHAVDLWEGMVLSKYTEIKYVAEESFRRATTPEAHYAVIQLAAMLCHLRSYARKKR